MCRRMESRPMSRSANYLKKREKPCDTHPTLWCRCPVRIPRQPGTGSAATVPSRPYTSLSIQRAAGCDNAEGQHKPLLEHHFWCGRTGLQQQIAVAAPVAP